MRKIVFKRLLLFASIVAFLFLWNCSSPNSGNPPPRLELTIPFDTVDVSQYDSVKIVFNNKSNPLEIIKELTIPLNGVDSLKEVIVPFKDTVIGDYIGMVTFFKGDEKRVNYTVVFSANGESSIFQWGIWTLEGLKDFALSTGDSLVLTFLVGGEVTKYEWYKDNQRLGETSYQFSQVVSVADKGVYRVKAIGKIGNLLSESEVVVDGVRVEKYKLFVEFGEKGTISPNSQLGYVNVSKGDDFTIEVLPDSGYEIDTVFVDSVPVSNSKYVFRKPYTFSNFIKNRTVSAVFKIKMYPVIISVDRGVQVDFLLDTVWLPFGTDTTINVTVDVGRKLKSLIVERDNKYDTLSLITTQIEVRNLSSRYSAVFVTEKNEFPIEVKSGIGGVITIDNPKIVVSGDSVLLTVLANEGYQLDSVQVNGILDSVAVASGQIILDSVTKSMIVEAWFSPLIYTIIYETDMGGTITSDSVNIKYGKDTSITYTVNAGYELDSVFVNGKAVSFLATDRQYEFTDVKRNNTLQTVYSCGRCKDSLALVALFDGSGGKSWKKKKNWKTAKPISQWEGVIVVKGRVGALNLRAHGLTSLPSAIGDFPYLTSLSLVFNDLKVVPAEIGKLSRLVRLELYNCGLKALPPEIEELSNLVTLVLPNNALTTLPAEIGKLLKLEELGVSRNRINRLPPEIGKLVSLKDFSIGGMGDLTSLPPEMGDLSSLIRLNISGNKITTLPGELVKLKKVTKFDMSANKVCKGLPKALDTWATARDSDWKKTQKCP